MFSYRQVCLIFPRSRTVDYEGFDRAGIIQSLQSRLAQPLGDVLHLAGGGDGGAIIRVKQGEGARRAS
jgi:hypothetical protein